MNTQLYTLDIKDHRLIATPTDHRPTCNKCSQCSRHLDNRPDVAAAVRTLIDCGAYDAELYDTLAVELCGDCPDNPVMSLGRIAGMFDILEHLASTMCK